MKWRALFVLTTILGLNAVSGLAAAETTDLSAEQLRDKIRGGLLGQLLGNLNGLPHEMKYLQDPGRVTEYTPSLPHGAWTDDDTDFEWVYIKVMQDEGRLLLPPERIGRLWKERINRRIWCSNLYARQLMDLGIDPPLTGTTAFNPWADFNISGQFICETFGLIAPAMPQTAARIGLNYTRVTIDGEPAQTTQLFTAMIATAFTTEDINAILDSGLAAVDPHSVVCQIVRDVRQWHEAYPTDWQATRRLLKEKYSKYNGEMRDRNGYELNTGSAIAALLYGKADFVHTLITAFNFGWDADNTAATTGTIIGIAKGYRWMLAQGWPIVDRYKNTTRQNMPNDETITSFADRLVDLAETVICEQGGQRTNENGTIVYTIKTEKPSCLQRLESPEEQIAALKVKMGKEIDAGLAPEASPNDLARAAYYAICLDLAESLRRTRPQRWSQALDALNGHPNIAQVLFHHSPTPRADILRRKALAAGLTKPPARQDLW